MTNDIPTIYDVARLCGVSASTVSRTFARPDKVSAATSAKVRAAAEEIGYSARCPMAIQRRAETKLLAITVADFSNPFHNQLVWGAQIASGHAGYELILADFHESSAREKAEHERLLDVADGIVIGSSRLSDPALRKIAAKKPTVVVSREVRGVASLVPDNASGARAAMALLPGLGHTAVPFAGGPEAPWADAARYRAVCDASAAAGHSAQRIGPFLPTFEDGLGAARQLVDRPPTAIIAHNDMLAIGLMHGLQAAGIRIPEDVSIVGIDDVLASRLVTPKLTTIALPALQLGLQAVRNVVALVRGAVPKSDSALVMPVQLKVRESTGPARRAQSLR